MFSGQLGYKITGQNGHYNFAIFITLFLLVLG
jgi:hypothetical protein